MVGGGAPAGNMTNLFHIRFYRFIKFLDFPSYKVLDVSKANTSGVRRGLSDRFLYPFGLKLIREVHI